MDIDFTYEGEHPVARSATIDHGIKVEICYDHDSEHSDPRDCDNPSVMYVNYRGYTLGDEQLPDGGFDPIECPVCEGGELPIIGPPNLRERVLGGGFEQVPPVCPRCEDWHEVEPTVDEWLRSINAIAAAPLFVYEHSGITMSCGTLRMVNDPLTRDDIRSTGRFMGDDAGWDTSFVGLIVFTEESLEPCCGTDPKYRTEKWLSECAESEVRVYAQWLEGDVYGYSIEDANGDHLDSCWGFIGYEYAEEEASRAADYAVKRVEKEMREVAEWAARDVETVR